MNFVITKCENYAIQIEPRSDVNQCHVNFKMWEITEGGYLDESSPVYVHGTVKWDGCVNFAFDDTGCMLHFCSIVGPNSFDEFREAFAHTYELCAKEMGDKWLDCIDHLGGTKS